MKHVTYTCDLCGASPIFVKYKMKIDSYWRHICGLCCVDNTVRSNLLHTSETELMRRDIRASIAQRAIRRKETK